MYQKPLPGRITNLSDDEAIELINECRSQLGKELVILGHHYQRNDVIQFADFTGDSLRLSQIAGEQDAKYIVFCGVHFMAESADILTNDKQTVFLPDMTAGCSMSDMADIDQVEDAWEVFVEQLPNIDRVVPATYVNSSASVKAFTGKNGGVCVTSSNCKAIFAEVWREDPEAVIFFLPDEHLGRNTAYEMGIPLEKMPVFDPFQENGGITAEQYNNAKVILWRGFCSVHGEFNVEQIKEARAKNPDVNIMVHPECNFDVVQAADASGSTAAIIKTLEAAPDHSEWVVGTEINLVKRMAEKLKGRHIKVRSLSGKACPCATMYRIDLPHLAWILENIYQHSQNPEIALANIIVVPAGDKAQSLIALNKMMTISKAAQKDIAS
jgi:quinolinate synthase